ncbi:alpha-E domain-containing protein [Parahaliea mediterranea]|uniref:Alpha-E domain-containing protein n=1 Tax=Parahaliea mediterranea TaxID=651086 RepID=A0A939IKK3_9GAMM|nr:alpha-E domain-containing protein [Parahaliea mediterranea]MBN7795540.1 alpha-E domain-containing protein [Parahaliea mediterranea]
MTMLSRVADRLYWMARYLERAEDTARLVASYHMLIMDIPRGSELGWDVLLRILDAEPQFYSRFRVPNEQNVVKFLLADMDNHGSVACSIRYARENVRTTRDVLPEETWEKVNELHLYSRELAEKSVGRRNRQAFLDEVVGRCQMINGMLLTTLSRDHAHRFSTIGHLLERCDMTTRVVDVGVMEIMERDERFAAIDPLLWSCMLQSLSALGAYRRVVGPLLEGGAIAEFVLKDPLQPRSVAFCLRGIREALKPLANNTEALRQLDSARRKLGRFNAEAMNPEQVHRYIDDFQSLLNRLHQAISRAWFQPESL